MDGSPPFSRHRLLPEPSDGSRADLREMEGERSQAVDMRGSTDRHARTGEREADKEAREMKTVVDIDEETPLLAPPNSGIAMGSDASRYGSVGGAERLRGMQEMVMDRGGIGIAEMAGRPAGMSRNPTRPGKAAIGDEEEAEDEHQPQCRICLESDGDDLIAPCKCKGSARFVHRSCLDQWRATKEGFAFCHCSTCKTRFHLRVCPPPDPRFRHIKFRFFVARDIVFVTLLVQMLIICFGFTAYVADYYFDMGLQKSWGVESAATFYYICGVLLFLVCAGLLGAVMTCVDRRIRIDLAAPWRDLEACCCDPRVCGGCRNCYLFPDCLCPDCSCCAHPCIGCSDCFADTCTGEGGICFLLLLSVVLAFVGVFYCLLVSILVVQRICQRHYHVLAKRILTKEYIVEDLSGMTLPPDWSPPPLLPEHERQLRDLGLL